MVIVDDSTNKMYSFPLQTVFSEYKRILIGILQSPECPQTGMIIGYYVWQLRMMPITNFNPFYFGLSPHSTKEYSPEY
jgi:hypothetical protein